MKDKIVNTNIGFGKVYYNSSDTSIKESINLIRRAYNLNKNFFKIRVNKIKIIFVYSRKELDKLWGQNTKSFVSAFSKKNNTIIIFSPEAMEKETRWKRKGFFPSMVHEMAHIFYYDIAKIDHPIWLTEGIATYIQHNKKPSKRKKIIQSFLEGGFNFDKSGTYYNNSHAFIHYLIKKYGKKKLLKLLYSMKKATKNTTIDDLIMKIYNKTIRELVKDANKMQTTFRRKRI